MATTKETKKTSKPKAKMSKGKKIAYIIGGVLGLGALGTGAYFAFGRKKEFPTNFDDTQIETRTSTGTATSSIPEGSFPLNFGAFSKKVMKVQNRLIGLGGDIAKAITSTGGADAKLGNGTRRAIELAGFTLPFTQAMADRLASKTANTTISTTGTSSSGSKFDNWLDRLRKAIFFFSFSEGGTDEEAIYSVMRELKTTDDYEKLDLKFIALSPNKNNLSWHIKDELFASELKIVRDILEKKGISHGLNGLGSIQKLTEIKGSLVRINQTGVSVWDENGKTLPVSPSMVLGKEIAKDEKNNVSSILTNDNVVIFAPSSALKRA